MKRFFRQMARPRQTDKEIVEAIRSGVEGRVDGALRQLYDHKSYVTNFVWKDGNREVLHLDVHYVNDLFQETIITFLKKVWNDEYQWSAKAEIRTYLYSIAHNKYLTDRKQAGQRLERAYEFVRNEDPDPSPQEVYINRERYSLVYQILDRLDKIGGVAGGELIRLFDFQQKSHAEIALIYGITEGAAKMRYFRAKQQLTSLLNSYDGIFD